MRTLSFPVALVALVLAVAAGPASAQDYQVEILRVIDGDTFAAKVRTWPGHTVEERVRVANIDTPEMRSKCEDAAAREREEQLAIQARDFAEAFLGSRAILAINWSRPRDGFGRILARVSNEAGEDLGKALIRAELAQPWKGRKGWCE